MPDYDNLSMTDIFGLDSAERIKALSQLILQLEKSSEDLELFNTAMREAHTLKAAARVVNCTEVQALSHSMEEVFEALKDQKITLTPECVDVLLETLDGISKIAEMFIKGLPHEVNIDAMQKRLEGAKKGEAQAKEAPSSKEASPPEPAKKETPQEPVKEESKAEDSIVRVGVDKLETMMNLAGEIYTNTLYLEGETQKINFLLQDFSRITSTFDAIQGLLDQEDSTSIKIQDEVNKNKAALVNFQDSFSEFVKSISNINLNFAHLGTDLQDEVMLSRMVPAATVFDVYVRVVRDFARDFNKKITLKIQGDQTLVDKTILEVLKDPLMHLMRNACDHGIEMPEERMQAGKKEEGTIILSASHKLGRVFIEIEDDGIGINIEHLKNKILEKDLVEKEKLSQMPEEEILDFIYHPGFSTAKATTNVSGRGVGLDVVKVNLATIGGDIKLETEEGKYSRFILSLPLTLAVTRSILAKSGGETICFPMLKVEEVLKVEQEKIKTTEGKSAIDVRGEIISLIELHSLWNLPQEDTPSVKKHVVIIGQNQEKVALSVESFLGEKEIVNKPLDRRLKKASDISGGTILDDGQIAYVVDVDNLIQSSSEHIGKSKAIKQEKTSQLQRQKILVVEDSLTVRELEKKVLESNGYDIVTAVDGQDGWEKVRKEKFDLVVTDIEMPRMNGFELISLIKKDESLCDIPTIIVSFKESEEDKRKGMEVGADKYITKSQYDDKILLESIMALIGHD